MVSVGGAKRSGGGSRGRPTEAAGALNSPGTGGSRPRGDRAEQADRCAPLRRAGGDDDRRGADPGTPAGRDPGDDHRRGRGLPRRPHPRGDVPGGTQAPVHPRLRAHRNRGQAGCPRKRVRTGPAGRGHHRVRQPRRLSVRSPVVAGASSRPARPRRGGHRGVQLPDRPPDAAPHRRGAGRRTGLGAWRGGRCGHGPAPTRAPGGPQALRNGFRDQAGVISALGATPIDYTKGSFVGRVRELTGNGVDVVLDGIGGRVALGLTAPFAAADGW